MISYSMCSTALNFDGDCEWTLEWRFVNPGDHYEAVWVNCAVHPEGGGWYRDFEEDAWALSIDELKTKWGIKELRALGKHLCRAGYIDKLNPEKSWTGKNPATMEKIRLYMEQLEKEEAEKNGSQPGKDQGSVPGRHQER